jgi:hypothetical protein
MIAPIYIFLCSVRNEPSVFKPMVAQSDEYTRICWHRGLCPGLLHDRVGPLSSLEGRDPAADEVSQMIVGPLKGAFLKMMVQLVQAARVLEIGMFTDYSAL